MAKQGSRRNKQCAYCIAQQIFADKTIRSHQQDKSLLGRIAMSDLMTELHIRDETGEDDIAVFGTFDFDRAMEMFLFIVRGLYFSFRSVVLPQDCDFRFGRLFKDDLEAWVQFFNDNGAFGPHEIGDGVFSCVYNYGATTEAATFWLLKFYDRVQYSVLTTPASRRTESSRRWRARIGLRGNDRRRPPTNQAMHASGNASNELETPLPASWIRGPLRSGPVRERSYRVGTLLVRRDTHMICLLTHLQA